MVSLGYTGLHEGYILGYTNLHEAAQVYMELCMVTPGYTGYTRLH